MYLIQRYNERYICRISLLKYHVFQWHIPMHNKTQILFICFAMIVVSTVFLFAMQHLMLQCLCHSYDFAKMFIEAGVAVPKDVFVGVFSKILE